MLSEKATITGHRGTLLASYSKLVFFRFSYFSPLIITQHWSHLSQYVYCSSHNREISLLYLCLYRNLENRKLEGRIFQENGYIIIIIIILLLSQASLFHKNFSLERISGLIDYNGLFAKESKFTLSRFYRAKQNSLLSKKKKERNPQQSQNKFFSCLTFWKENKC